MSQTISQRLQVLIARAYKAEQLYQSVSSSSDFDSVSGKMKPLLSSLRSREWYLVYKELRVKLNEISRLKNSGDILSAIVETIEKRELEIEKTAETIEKEQELAEQTTRKRDYNLLVVKGMMLLSLKAKLQALRAVIADLKALLSFSPNLSSKSIERIGKINRDRLDQLANQQDSDQMNSEDKFISTVVSFEKFKNNNRAIS